MVSDKEMGLANGGASCSREKADEEDPGKENEDLEKNRVKEKSTEEEKDVSKLTSEGEEIKNGNPETIGGEMNYQRDEGTSEKEQSVTGKELEMQEGKETAEPSEAENTNQEKENVEGEIIEPESESMELGDTEKKKPEEEDSVSENMEVEEPEKEKSDEKDADSDKLLERDIEKEKSQEKDVGIEKGGDEVANEEKTIEKDASKKDSEESRSTEKTTLDEIKEDVKEKPKKVSSDTESEDDSDKPQIFVRNFAEITEQQSDSDDDVVCYDNFIPSGIASSYRKTISELPDYVEEITSEWNKPSGLKLEDVATYDVSLAGLDLDCDRKKGRRHRQSLDIKKSAYKLDTWLTRTKNKLMGSNGVVPNSAPTTVLRVPDITSPPAPVSVTPSSYRPQLPISVQRPPHAPLRWQQSQVTISAASNSMPVGSRPPVLITSTPSSISNAVPRPQGWPQAQRMIIRTTQSLPSGTSISLQQGIGKNTTTTFTTGSRLPTVACSTVPQQVATQLIFDPSTGGLILCPTNQLPTQTSISANNRLPTPANFNLQNGMILRPATDKNGLEVSLLNSSVANSSARLQQPVLMSRMTSPMRIAGPQTQLTRPPVTALRSIRPQVPQAPGNPRQTPPVPALQQMTASQQYRNRNVTPPQPVLPPRTIAANVNPPRYPSPRVNGIPPVRQITSPSSKTGTTTSQGTVGAGVTAGNQKPIPGTVDDADSELQNKTFPSLVVHVKTILSNKPDRQAQTKARSELDANVKSALVNTPAQFTEWLMRRGLLRLDHFCEVHPNQAFKLGMYSDVSRQPFSGGYVWTSECCPEKQVSVFNGSIFEGSKYPPGTVLKLIYHWSCQTPANNVLQWVKISSLYLKNFFTLLRAVCISWLHEMCPLLGGEMRYVEIGVITLGSSAETSKGVKNVNVEILGVFDPSTKIVRMKVINSMQGQLFKDNKSKAHANEQGARAFQILWPLTHWVDKRSILLVDGIIDKALFHELGFKNIQQCSEANRGASANNMNIMNYLRNLVPKMFSSTLSVLSKSIVQQFLDELSWREMYGQTVLQCFETMLDHVGTMTKWELKSEPLINRLNKVYQNPFVDWSYSKQLRRCPVNTIPLSLRNEPGIKECIRFVMKDDKNLESMLGSKVPPPPPVVQTTSIGKTAQMSSAQKRKLGETSAASNLAFYKNYAASYIKQVCLQKYYYGRIPCDDNAVDNSFTPNLKCPLCVRTFTSSGEIIRHLYVHAGALIPRNSESSVCSVCLKDLQTGASLSQHMNLAHRMMGQPFSCRVCEEKFRNEDDLVFHMWDLHNPREPAYKCCSCTFASSYRHETIQHYQEKHGSSGSVLCPFCMKKLSAHTSQMLKNVAMHLQNHRTRKCKKCPRCTLNFCTDGDLDYHMQNHLTYTGEDWQVDELNGESPIMMAIPPESKTPLKLVPFHQLSAVAASPPPPKKPKLNSGAKKKTAESNKSTLNASFAVPLDTNEKFGGSKYKVKMPSTVTGNSVCMECNRDTMEPDHYIGRLVCSKCRYITSCKTAMDLHHERNHKGTITVTMPGMTTKEVNSLNEPLICKCGFSSTNPYSIANHLIKCEKLTVYPKSKIIANKNVEAGKEQPPAASSSSSNVSSSEGSSQQPPLSTSPGLGVVSSALSPKSLETMLSEPITTFEDMLSLDACMDTSLESLALPSLLSPSNNTMPQTPMPSFDPNITTPSTTSSTGTTQQTNNNNTDPSSNWHPDNWELPVGIAKCMKGL